MTAVNINTTPQTIRQDLIISPEDCLEVAAFAQGIQLEPMDTAITRADAILSMLSLQFEDSGSARVNDECVASVIHAARGELGILAALVKHGFTVQDVEYQAANLQVEKVSSVKAAEMLNVSERSESTAKATRASKGISLLHSALESHNKAYDALQSINSDGLETYVNSIIKAAYMEACKHLKATADYAHKAYGAGLDDADVDVVDEIANQCGSLATVCGLVAAVPESDHDLAALDSLLFYGLDSIKECICKLGGIETQSN